MTAHVCYPCRSLDCRECDGIAIEDDDRRVVCGCAMAGHDDEREAS